MSVFNKEVENRPPKRVPVVVADLKLLLRLAEKLTRAIHSNGRISRDDKLPMLADVAQMKRTLHGYIQLELFSDAQLER